MKIRMQIVGNGPWRFRQRRQQRLRQFFVRRAGCRIAQITDTGRQPGFPARRGAKRITEPGPGRQHRRRTADRQTLGSQPGIHASAAGKAHSGNLRRLLTQPVQPGLQPLARGRRNAQDA